MSNGQAMARLRRAITKVAATGATPVAIVREVFGDVTFTHGIAARRSPSPAIPDSARSQHGVIYSNAKMRFQSFFMLITVQPFFLASS
jgi:hypothetical protein